MNILKGLIGFFCSIYFCSCGVYSFTGASISPDTKTVSVAIFENTAKLVVPNLSQKLTEELKTQILNGTSLSQILDPQKSDVIFEGQITDYTVAPVAISGGGAENSNSVAQSSRLTITINVKFTDKKHEKNSFEQSFSRYEDFGSDKNLSQVEQSLIDLINKTLVQDIYNRAFVNW
jgi:Lipopolysaccharide-assembly